MKFLYEIESNKLFDIDDYTIEVLNLDIDVDDVDDLSIGVIGCEDINCESCFLSIKDMTPHCYLTKRCRKYIDEEDTNLHDKYRELFLSVKLDKLGL